MVPRSGPSSNVSATRGRSRGPWKMGGGGSGCLRSRAIAVRYSREADAAFVTMSGPRCARRRRALEMGGGGRLVAKMILNRARVPSRRGTVNRNYAGANANHRRLDRNLAAEAPHPALRRPGPSARALPARGRGRAARAHRCGAARGRGAAPPRRRLSGPRAEERAPRARRSASATGWRGRRRDRSCTRRCCATSWPRSPPCWATPAAARLVIKGAAMAELYYPDRRLRPYFDLDLLVAHEHLETGAAALEARGYARLEEFRPGYADRFGHDIRLRRRVAGRWADVELHWRVGDDPVGVSLSHSRLARDAQRVEIDGATLAVPAAPAICWCWRCTCSAIARSACAGSTTWRWWQARSTMPPGRRASRSPTSSAWDGRCTGRSTTPSVTSPSSVPAPGPPGPRPPGGPCARSRSSTCGRPRISGAWPSWAGATGSPSCGR